MAVGDEKDDSMTKDEYEAPPDYDSLKEERDDSNVYTDPKDVKLDSGDSIPERSEKRCEVKVIYIVLAVFLGTCLVGVLVYFTLTNSLNKGPAGVNAANNSDAQRGSVFDDTTIKSKRVTTTPASIRNNMMGNLPDDVPDWVSNQANPGSRFSDPRLRGGGAPFNMPMNNPQARPVPKSTQAPTELITKTNMPENLAQKKVTKPPPKTTKKPPPQLPLTKNTPAAGSGEILSTRRGRILIIRTGTTQTPQLINPANKFGMLRGLLRGPPSGTEDRASQKQESGGQANPPTVSKPAPKIATTVDPISVQTQNKDRAPVMLPSSGSRFSDPRLRGRLRPPTPQKASSSTSQQQNAEKRKDKSTGSTASTVSTATTRPPTPPKDMSQWARGLLRPNVPQAVVAPSSDQSQSGTNQDKSSGSTASTVSTATTRPPTPPKDMSQWARGVRRLSVPQAVVAPSSDQLQSGTNQAPGGTDSQLPEQTVIRVPRLRTAKVGRTQEDVQNSQRGEGTVRRVAGSARRSQTTTSTAKTIGAVGAN